MKKEDQSRTNRLKAHPKVHTPVVLENLYVGMEVGSYPGEPTAPPLEGTSSDLIFQSPYSNAEL